MTTVIDTPEGIALFQLRAQIGALRLEVLGMTRRGRSMYSIAKQHYNLKGSKKSVLAQLEAIYKDRLEAFERANV